MEFENRAEPIANSILTNSNVKIFMRGNDPDSAEYFSKVIGTEKGTKFTERQTRGLFNRIEKTGEMSAREGEEFSVHPNVFKRELGVGEAIMLIPHNGGTKKIKIKFGMFPDIRAKPLPVIEKTNLALLETPRVKPNANESEESAKTESVKSEEGLNAAAIKNKNTAEAEKGVNDENKII